METKTIYCEKQKLYTDVTCILVWNNELKMSNMRIKIKSSIFYLLFYLV